MVATSNAGSAFAGIILGGGGGSGIFHAVSAVERVRLSVSPPLAPVQLPVIEFPSPLSFPTYVAPMDGIAIFTAEPFSVTSGAAFWPP
jgi:hypothetical protein